MELFLPFLLLIFASFFQGTFGLGMKYMNPMSWESWWVVHVLVAMILFPMIWAIVAIPDLFEIISNMTSETSDAWTGQNFVEPL